MSNATTRSTVPKRLPAHVLAALNALPAQDRKHMSHDLLMLMLLNLRHTGECVLTRQQLADHIGCKADHVSTMMTTLERLGIARRSLAPLPGTRSPRVATYSVNLEAITRRSSVRRKPARSSEPTRSARQGAQRRSGMPPGTA